MDHNESFFHKRGVMMAAGTLRHAAAANASLRRVK